MNRLVIQNHNGKPIIAGKVPFWRHYKLPWGWYQLIKLHFNAGDIVNISGYYKPGNGGENTYEVVTTINDNGGKLIDCSDDVQILSIGFFTKGDGD